MYAEIKSTGTCARCCFCICSLTARNDGPCGPSPRRTTVSSLPNPCESAVYHISRDVQWRSKYWIKGQPYSLRDMFADDAVGKEFVNGTVYQAYLSARSYHRWHAPVTGQVVCAFVRDGTYYSTPLWTGPDDDDGGQRIEANALASSQGYLIALATRAILVIRADDPRVGLVACIFVGMDEVSSTQLTLLKGQRVRKGAQVGMFHFGGSSFAILFQNRTVVEDFPSVNRRANVPVRGRLAVVRP